MWAYTQAHTHTHTHRGSVRNMKLEGRGKKIGSKKMENEFEMHEIFNKNVPTEKE